MTFVGVAGQVRIESPEAHIERDGKFPGLVHPADSLEIVVVLGHVARPQRGTLLGIDDAIERGDGSIVKEGSRCPNAVERRGVIALDDLDPRLPSRAYQD